MARALPCALAVCGMLWIDPQAAGQPFVPAARETWSGVVSNPAPEEEPPAADEPSTEPVATPPAFDAVPPNIPPVAGTAEEDGRNGPEWKKHFYPHFRLGGFYDDNIFIQHDDKQADFVGVVGFGLRAGFGEVQSPLYSIREGRNVPLLYEAPAQPQGNFVLADYSGSVVRFMHTPSQNSYDQDFLLSAGWTDTKFSVGFEGRIQSLSSSNIDVGDRVRRQVYSATLHTRYEVSGKTSLEANFSSVTTNYEKFISNREWLNEEWFNYQITPKITISPGVGIGLLQIEHSPDQNYERLLLRTVYEATAKLSFNGRMGLEYRNAHDGEPLRHNPIFGFGLNYAPFSGTTLGLDGYRSTEASALVAGENYTRTGVDLILRQRFLQKFHVTATGGYEHLDYSQAGAGKDFVDREDHYFFARLAVAFDLTQWCNAQVFYNHQRDLSSESAQSFTDNQVGLELNFSF